MRKVGKVINIEKNKVYIITKDKEFITVTKNSNEPIIGELYAGQEFQKVAIWKHLLVVIAIVLISFFIRKVYIENKYSFSAVIDMNCPLKVQINGSGKITKAEGLSSKGYKILGLLDLKHKSFEEALYLILDESINQKYLTKAHAEDGFKLSIFISTNDNNTEIDLTKFIKYAKTKNFEVLLNNNGQLTIN